jgi:hypothetical protein
MKTGNPNSRIRTILLCAGVVVATILACRIPVSVDRTADEEAAAVADQAISDQVVSDPEEAIQPIEEQPGAEPAIRCYEGIIPGVTTRAEVVSLLGQPVATDQEGAGEWLLYSAPISGQNNVILVENDRVTHISLVFAEERIPRLSGIQGTLGQPAHTTYSTYMRGSRTYIYPQQGLVFIGDPLMDVIFIQECFAPQSLAEFMQRHGSSLPQQDPYVRQAQITDEGPTQPEAPAGEAATDRLVWEPLLIYPGARVIHDEDDQYTEIYGFLIVAVDAPLEEVVKYYREQYQDGFFGVDAGELEEGARGIHLLNNRTLDEISEALQNSEAPDRAVYSLTLISVLPGVDFDGPQYMTIQDYSMGEYAMDETLIIFQLSHIQKYLEILGEE